MNSNNYKWLVIAMWIVSWLLIFWINFSAELPLVIHFVATPLLLICSAASAGFYLESTLDARIAGNALSRQ
ncbi:hypothetical protein [Arsukibacterium sp.]|uniref:hypothetical protein n=1 Tax=Arsukibacterium sp. TaxID=1977258 RepID=UPI00299E820F|nr:hypothetical protein [Arsukibacterium sp.]MDX1536306.1 hypothetical protein [Arsukibacterium sp.]